MPKLKRQDPDLVKRQVIRLRVTEAEAELFGSKAKEAGCKSLSEFIRTRCIEDENADIIKTRK